jgi:hypothetical protein
VSEIDKAKLAELIDWARENSRYGPAPTVMLPSSLAQYADGLRVWPGTVCIAHGIDRPMVAFSENPVQPLPLLVHS